MQPEKFTDTVSKELLKWCLTRSEIAGAFELSKSTVSERLNALKIGVSKGTTLRSAGEIVRKQLDTVGQLHEK
jgi:DNA invertase Pin-like site-specific DNA recombinase